MENSQKPRDEKISKTAVLLAVIAMGTVCGVIEVAGKQFLHQINFPYTSAILVGLCFGIIGIGLAVIRKPIIIIVMAAVAVICKQLVVPILGVSLMCKANACVAVMLEYGSLAAIAAITMGRMKKNVNMRILTAGTAAFLGAATYFFIGMHVKPCPYMLSFNVSGGFVKFLTVEGLIWAAFAAIMFPFGWTVGEKLREKTLILLEHKRLSYLMPVLTASICFIGCIISIWFRG